MYISHSKHWLLQYKRKLNDLSLFSNFIIYGIPEFPGETNYWHGTQFVGDVDLYRGYGRAEVPLHTLVGRGNVSFPLSLYYSTHVSDMEDQANDEGQASWVGMGWGLDAPYIFGYIEVDEEDVEEGRGGLEIIAIDTYYKLFWNGIPDPIETTGDWELKYRKHWKVEKTTYDVEDFVFVGSFTLTDINGTKYTFEHRRETCLTLWDDEEKTDQVNDVPYRWDLTKIEDVTGNNSISIVYDDINGTCYGHSYTQASYLDTIKCDASARYFIFELANRSDWPSSSDDPAAVYEKKRLDYILLKNSSESVLWRYNFHPAYHSSLNEQKLLLDHAHQRNPANTDSLPSWKFHYRTDEESNPGALEILTTPQGGTKTFVYTANVNNWRVSSVSIDRKMGAGSETTSYSAAGTTVTVTPPGSIGSTNYYLNNDTYGLNVGTLDRVELYDNSSDIVAKTEYTLVDSTIKYREYEEVRGVTFIYSGGHNPSDSLIVVSRTWYSTLNGLPYYTRDDVTPFEPRGFTISTSPSQMHLFRRTRAITYAASIYTGMNADSTHQLAAVYQEIIREEVKDQGTTWKTAPISAARTLWTQPSGAGFNYYRPDTLCVWTGSDVASDTTISWSSSETIATRVITLSDTFGHVLEEKDGEGRITRYYYGDNSNNLSNTASGLQRRFLTGISRVNVTVTDSLVSKTDWDGDMGLISDVEDANGSKTKTEFDDYYRLYRTKNNGDVVLSEITYSFARDQSGDDSFDSSKPNYTRSKSQFIYDSLTPPDTTYTYSTVFTDGLGRTLQTHQRNGTNDIIQAVGYYSDGALRATYTPYDTSNSDHSYENPANFGVKDSTYFEYESDSRRRINKTTYPTMDTSTRPYSSVSYTIDTWTDGPADDHKFIEVTTTDENGVAHVSWIGVSGNLCKTTTESYAAETWQNVLGAAALVLPPETGGSRTNQLRTDITNSPFGREIERDEPDQNTTKTVYDRNLVPIYVQEAADASAHNYWVTIYDNYGRVSRIGLEQDSTSSGWYSRIPVAPSSTEGSDNDEWRKKYYYDTDYFGSGTTYSEGRLTKVEGNYDTTSTVEYYEYYQYSREGLTTKQRQNVSGAISRDISYEYDTGGRLRKVIFADAQNPEEFFIWYDYDSAGRLHKIYSHTSNSKPDTATAEYAYNARGQITQEKLGGTVQQVDYSYNDRGFLTDINDMASPGTDRFAMQLGYDDDIGVASGWSAEKNGNISQVKWFNAKWDTTTYFYTFDYNSRNHLSKADCSNDTFDVSSYIYEGNGNLLYLTQSSTWTYRYNGDEAWSRRVDDIENLTSDDNWDYDASGRQIKDTNGSFSSCTYHFPGAAFHNVTMSGGTLQMRYNAGNRRLQKIVVGGTTTNYVRDISGQILAVYDTTSISERYVWGPTGLISIVKGNNTEPTRYYTITDHLGSVRSVVNTNGTAVAGYDYYPYGKELRSSVTSGAGSRFMFQGKEFDTELSINLYYFEARFYRPDIARFVAPDPMRQGWSYYSFAANNPMRFVDPSGLAAEEAPMREDWSMLYNYSSYRYGGRGFFLDASGVAMDWFALFDVEKAKEWATNLLNSLIHGTQGGGTILLMGGVERDVSEVSNKGALISIFAAYKLGLDSGSFVGTQYASDVSGIYKVLTEMKPSIWALTQNSARKLNANGAWGWAKPTSGSYEASGWALALDFDMLTSREKLAPIMFHETLHLWDYGRCKYQIDFPDWLPLDKIPRNWEQQIKIRANNIIGWWNNYKYWK